MDLEKLNKWSKDWQMEFNIDKCQVMHLGKKSLNSQYVLSGNALKPTESERDLGVLVENLLNSVNSATTLQIVLMQ